MATVLPIPVGTSVMEGVAWISVTEAVGTRVVMVMVLTGTTVTGTTEGVTAVERAGQFVIVGAQLMMVTSLVEYFVS